MDSNTNNLTSEKKNLYLEYALFLILGFLLGIVIKTEAGKRITIGFNDYQAESKQEAYDLNKLQKDLMDQKSKEQKQPQQPEAQNNKSNQPAAEGAETSR